MKKTRAQLLKGIMIIPAAILTFLIVIVVLWFILLGIVYIGGQVERNHIRREILSYVQENAEIIELNDPNNYQEFFYTATGLQDGGVEYGYYFSPNNEHTLQGDPYRKGYRIYGIPDDHSDWYYSERICKNWFYYEIHDG